MTFAACIASSIILSVHRNIVHRNNEILICLCTGTKDKNPCLCTGTLQIILFVHESTKTHWSVCAQEHQKPPTRLTSDAAKNSHYTFILPQYSQHKGSINPAVVLQALFSPKTSILIQKRPLYSGNLNSKAPGDSKNAFLHWGDVLGDSDDFAESS